MSRIVSLLKSRAGVAFAAGCLLAFEASSAYADACVQNCRGNHNACRMATKLLASPNCDAQLQACIASCFAGARSNREFRDGPGFGGFGRFREFGGTRDLDGPRGFGGFRDRR